MRRFEDVTEYNFYTSSVGCLRTSRQAPAPPTEAPRANPVPALGLRSVEAILSRRRDGRGRGGGSDPMESAEAVQVFSGVYVAGGVFSDGHLFHPFGVG